MAVLTTCLCCSLLTGSLTIAIMSTFLYGLAFAMELWMLVETDVSLSVPAYILTIGYLLMSLLSLALVASLRSARWQTLIIFPIRHDEKIISNHRMVGGNQDHLDNGIPTSSNQYFQASHSKLGMNRI